MKNKITTILLLTILSALFTNCEQPETTKTIKVTEYITYKPTTKAQLKALIELETTRQGFDFTDKISINNAPNLNNIDTSAITDMSELFKDHDIFEYDISKWDVSNVTNMQSMFEGVRIHDVDISNWDVSKVTNMKRMFAGKDTLRTNLRKANISKWDVSNVANMQSMFEFSLFNQDISKWNISKVTNMQNMFNDSYSFTQNLEAWGPKLAQNVNKTNMFYRVRSLPKLPTWCPSNPCRPTSK